MSIYQREKVCKIHKFFKNITLLGAKPGKKPGRKKLFVRKKCARETVDNASEI